MDETKVVAFAFAPHQFVTVRHLGLESKGRVNRCIWGASRMLIYEIEYNLEGEIKAREFYEDELEPRSA